MTDTDIIFGQRIPEEDGSTALIVPLDDRVVSSDDKSPAQPFGNAISMTVDIPFDVILGDSVDIVTENGGVPALDRPAINVENAPMSQTPVPEFLYIQSDGGTGGGAISIETEEKLALANTNKLPNGQQVYVESSKRLYYLSDRKLSGVGMKLGNFRWIRLPLGADFTGFMLKEDAIALVENTDAYYKIKWAQLSMSIDSLKAEFGADVTYLDGKYESNRSLFEQTTNLINLNVDATRTYLDGRITKQEAQILIQAGQILLKASLSDLDPIKNRLFTAESSIIQQATEIALRVKTVDFDQLSGRVVSSESVILQHAADIMLRAKQSDVDALGSKVSQALIAIDGANAKIDLKADQTLVSSLGTTISQALIAIDGAKADILLRATKEEVGVLSQSISQAQIDINGAKAEIQLRATKTEVSALDTRINAAQISIDGANAKIDLKAEKSVVDALGSQMSAAQIDINGAKSQISLLATKIEVNALATRTSAAEVAISAATAEIQLRATKTEVSALQTIISSAQVKIDGAASKIELSTVQSQVTTLSNSYSSAQIDIDALKQSIQLKAEKSVTDNLSGRVTTAEGTITVQAGLIASKVATSDFTTLTGRVTTAESSITQSASKISLIVNADDTIVSGIIVDAINNGTVLIQGDRLQIDSRITTVGNFAVSNSLVGSGKNADGTLNGSHIIIDPDRSEITFDTNGVRGIRITTDSLTPLALLKSNGGSYYYASGSSPNVNNAIMASHNDVAANVGNERTTYVGKRSTIAAIEPAIASEMKWSLTAGGYSVNIPYVLNIIHNSTYNTARPDGRPYRLTGNATAYIEVSLCSPSGVLSTIIESIPMSVDSGDRGISYQWAKIARFNVQVVTPTDYWVSIKTVIANSTYGIRYQSFNHSTWGSHSYWSEQYNEDVRYEVTLGNGMSVDGSIGITELTKTGFQSVWSDTRYFRLDGSGTNQLFLESRGRWMHNGNEVDFTVAGIAAAVNSSDLFATKDFVRTGFYNRTESDGRYLGLTAQAADSAKLGGVLAGDFWNKNNANNSAAPWTAKDITNYGTYKHPIGKPFYIQYYPESYTSGMLKDENFPFTWLFFTGTHPSAACPIFKFKAGFNLNVLNTPGSANALSDADLEIGQGVVKFGGSAQSNSFVGANIGWQLSNIGDGNLNSLAVRGNVTANGGKQVWDAGNLNRSDTDFTANKMFLANNCQIGNGGQYLSLKSGGNEIIIGGGTGMHVNYREAAGGTPSSWVWHKGTSDSYADFLLGNVYSYGSVQSNTFTGAGFTATGWGITNDGDANFRNHIVRGKLTTYEFVQNKISIVNGNMIVSDNAKVKSIVRSSYNGNPYTKLFFEELQPFRNGDTVRCQSNGKLYQGNIGWSSYEENDGGNYILIYDKDITTGVYTTISAGDFLVRWNSTDAARKGLLYLCSSDAGSPNYQVIYDGQVKAQFGNLEGRAWNGGTLPANTWGSWAENGYFTGAINATSGKVGNFTISRNLYAGVEYNTGIGAGIGLYCNPTWGTGYMGFLASTSVNDYIEINAGGFLQQVNKGVVISKFEGATGNGFVARGNIAWDAAGNVTFADSVKMQWQSGGRNYVPNSKGDNATGWSCDGIHSGNFLRDVSTTVENFIFSPYFYLPEAGTYTLSFFVNATGNISGVEIFGLPENWQTIGIPFADTVTTRNGRYKKTFTVNSNQLKFQLRFDNNGSTNGLPASLYISKVKIEKGYNATDWTPALEDIDGKLTQITSTGAYIGTIDCNMLTGNTIKGKTFAAIDAAGNNLLQINGSNGVLETYKSGKVAMKLDGGSLTFYDAASIPGIFIKNEPTLLDEFLVSKSPFSIASIGIISINGSSVSNQFTITNENIGNYDMNVFFDIVTGTATFERAEGVFNHGIDGEVSISYDSTILIKIEVTVEKSIGNGQFIWVGNLGSCYLSNTSYTNVVSINKNGYGIRGQFKFLTTDTYRLKVTTKCEVNCNVTEKSAEFGENTYQNSIVSSSYSIQNNATVSIYYSTNGLHVGTNGFVSYNKTGTDSRYFAVDTNGYGYYNNVITSRGNMSMGSGGCVFSLNSVDGIYLGMVGNGISIDNTHIRLNIPFVALNTEGTDDARYRLYVDGHGYLCRNSSSAW